MISLKTIKNKLKENKRGQVKGQATLFIILAIVIVALVILLIFIFGKVSLTKENEVESYFVSCIDNKMKQAVATAELQGGFLDLPGFEQGSEVYPSSNYLTFLALDIPYWNYVSGNGIYKTQKLTLSQIEAQFSKYLENAAKDCLNFRDFSYLNVTHGSLQRVSVNINDNYIESTILLPIKAESPDMKYSIQEHKIKTQTNFGSLYKTASIIFDAQNERTIISNYSIDIINAYAPTTGLEISCMPKIWSKTQVSDELKEALQENLAAIKAKGSSYHLKSSENRYFVADFGQDIDKQVNFLYSKDWLTKIDIWPSDGDILRMDPIGNQQGLGILGFCIIPYHFVYDLDFPVLVQVTSGTEIFQFPMVIVIDKMIPQKASLNETLPITIDLCKTPGQIGTVFTSYNSQPVESSISFRCLMQTCEIDKTTIEGDKARLTTEFPKCVNGYIIARAPGYQDSEALVSSNEPFILDLTLEPVYELTLDIVLENDENAIITFTSEKYSQTIFYPEQTEINLSEGIYDVTVQIYKQTNLNLGSQEVEKCIKVPSAGIPGLLGMTTEQCYNLTLPSSQLTSVPIGGGKSQFSVTDQELKSARKIKISAEELDTPTDIDEIANIYDLIDATSLTITLS
jgi:hypothetical protein